ncbi:MAG: MoaD/ThiS family protein [Gemmatimonadales bacterium]
MKVPEAGAVTVLLFAQYAELGGGGRWELPLPPDATVGGLLAALRQAAGGAASLPDRPLCAVNRRQARLTDPVARGDEVAFLPPLAGG